MTAVLIFGEVIPQAICIGPNQLAIAECTAPLVTLLCWITAPITYPLAKSLDMMLGEHKLTRFSNAQLEALVKMHCVDYMKECAEAGQHFETLDVGESIDVGIS